MQSSTSHERAEPAPRTRRVIARRLAVGFGLVSVVSVTMCALLLSLIGEVSGLVHSMRDDEAAIQESLALATAVREQYIHQAHWLIGGEPEHLDHQQDWYARVEAGVATLRPLIPESEQHRLDQLRADSRELHDMFRDAIRPAAERGDRLAVAESHRRAQRISQRAAEQADAIARGVEQKMATAHVSATRATRLGLVSGVVGALLVVVLALAFTLRLRNAVLAPLDRLADAARRFGSGDSRVRVGNVGEGEFRALAEAFDAMAEELEARERRLVESERLAAIGQLAAGVAHEINNPIGIIRGYLKTMGPDSPPETLREELQILDEEAAACQSIAEDLVTFARAPELRRDSFALDTLLADTVRRFRETDESGGLPVRLDCPPGEVYADAGRLRQVVLNLLMNAAQVSAEDDPIEVDADRSADGDWQIRVSDRGPGIPAEDRGRVFEPFFSKRSGGSGLGLALCRGIVGAHGGSIRAEDRAGGGCVLRVTLPGHAGPEETSS
ncbi:MAG: HAMP domain-containing protein [Deltaproteobacteria bacterium]|nr:HAMP domain-containing protein [Deltaproteobacteria bacterium]MBW2417594.1 HAMP domain-containing protein [Deltaproteobacteria bacterium]